MGVGQRNGVCSAGACSPRTRLHCSGVRFGAPGLFRPGCRYPGSGAASFFVAYGACALNGAGRLGAGKRGAASARRQSFFALALAGLNCSPPAAVIDLSARVGCGRSAASLSDQLPVGYFNLATADGRTGGTEPHPLTCFQGWPSAGTGSRVACARHRQGH